jgi:CRISPR system Cascade subunit CasE
VAEALNMVRMDLDVRRLFRRGMTSKGDLGYQIHARLEELFSGWAPSPFAVVHSGRGRMEILGYSERSASELETRAREEGDRDLLPLLDWTGFRSKCLPAAFPVGMSLGFRTRVCPVVRKNSAGPIYRKGAEVDAFLAAAEKVDPDVPLDREEIYRDWFLAGIKRMGGAEILSARLTSLGRTRLLRRNRERKGKLLDRPDVTWEGELSVTDSGAFHGLLRRGIGRHRAFGFGMILLTPGSPRAC